MKKQRKLMTKLNLLLVILLLMASPLSAYANVAISTDAAGNYLKQLGIFTGYEDGSLGLDRNITRAEFSALAVRLLGLEEQHEANKGKTAFKDVPADFWASGYINIAVSKGLFTGFEDQTFRPQEHITYAQIIAVLVRLLGYEKEVTGEWPQGHIDKATELKINNGITYQPSQAVNRGDIAVMIHQSMDVVLK